MAKNGSAPATIETDDNRAYFLIDIPCHDAFLNGGKIEQIEDGSGTGDPKNDPIKEGLSSRQSKLVELMLEYPSATREELVKKSGFSMATLKREITLLREKGYVSRQGSRKSGVWVVLKNK